MPTFAYSRPGPSLTLSEFAQTFACGYVFCGVGVGEFVTITAADGVSDGSTTTTVGAGVGVFDGPGVGVFGTGVIGASVGVGVALLPRMPPPPLPNKKNKNYGNYYDCSHYRNDKRKVAPSLGTSCVFSAHMIIPSSRIRNLMFCQLKDI